MNGRDPGRPQPKAPVLTQATCADFSIPAADLIDRLDYELSKKVYLGDSLPMVNMDSFGPGVVAAFLGAQVDSSTGAVWLHPPSDISVEDLHFSYDPESIWLRRIKEICAAAMDRWQGLVLVRMTDLGGALDILSSFRPSEKLPMDLIDSLEEVKRLVGEIPALWHRFRAEIDDVLQPVNPGYASWCQIYSDKPFYICQSDFSFMISADMLREFVRDELDACTRRLPHLHRPGLRGLFSKKSACHCGYGIIIVHYNIVKDIPPIIELRREPPVYQQIGTRLRADIESGELSCGARLPSVQALAKQYQTSVFTIQTALNALAEDGLIDRTRGRGTFITSSSTRLTNVAIYFGANLWHGGEMAYYRGLYDKLVAELDSRKIRHRLWVETRPAGMQGEPLPELAEAASRRTHQGLIIGISKPELSWLNRLGLPLAVHGTPPLSARVVMDSEQLFELALGDLKDRGCRTVGMITPVVHTDHPPEASSGDVEGFFRSFKQRLGAFGLKTKNSWVRTPSRPLLSQGHEEFGYREFLEIWSQPERPDGLFVYPDTAVKGTITAILQKSVAVPEDLKLVFHRNEGVPILCPVEASWMVTDTGGVARALIDLVERQLAGQKVEPILVPFGFEKSSLE